MAEKILFVFEGEKTEQTITDSFLECFISNPDRVVISSYKTDIYALYKDIKEDEELDAFAVVLERNKSLSGYTRDSFSQMFLFFDYDGHAPAAKDHKINDLLEFFNEETDRGRLFISYPMVESLKCIDSFEDVKGFCDLTYKISDGSSFKHFVSGYANKDLIHFNLYNKEKWNNVVRMHCIKASYISDGCLRFPVSPIEQNEIFKIQSDKYIKTIGEVATLSSFPLFLLSYFGHSGLFAMVSGGQVKA